MRVIAGSAKGKKLKRPGRLEIRPTSDKIKGAIFNILGEKIHDLCVLDLFAGTGSLGIEALSRGAAWVTFVEINPKASALVVANLEHTGFSNRANLINGDALKVLQRLGRQGKKFDLVFIDPPFESSLVRQSLEILDQGICLYKGAIIIARQPPKIDTEEVYRRGLKNLSLVDYRKYGDSTVLIFSFTASQ